MSDAADTHWARPILERQVALLAALAEAGLAVAQELQSRAAEVEAARLDSVALALSRVSRAVRLTVMLQSKLIGEIDAGAAQAKAASQTAHGLRVETHKARVERIVERVAVAEGRDEDALDRLVIEAGERLDDEDLYGDVLARPVGELVARICADLGLEADWAGLAEEEWAIGESGDPASPFWRPGSAGEAIGGAGPSATPIPIQDSA